MSPALSHEIVRLSPTERLALIGELWDSIDGAQLPLTSAQAKELDRRIETLDHERPHAVLWGSVKADLSARTRN